MKTPARILVARSDKLGDFMLTWPALATLRKALPDARIDLLVSAPVAEIGSACPYSDGVIIDQGQALMGLGREIRQNRYDAAIALFSTARVAGSLLLGAVPYRLAPATKLAQVLFNHRLVQRRSRSEQPEHVYNTDLVYRFLADHGIDCPEVIQGPYLRLSRGERDQAEQALRWRYRIPSDARLVVLHPGSGGSANNLSTARYAELANRLTCADDVFVLVTAGPGEKAQAERVAQAISAHPAAVHASCEGLMAFAHVLALADMFISGSTGPLHIAGALDVPTAAFYPRRQSSTALRWQTTNRPEKRLAFSPPENAQETDMDAVDMAAAATMISEVLLRVRQR
ncbi:glycosyltransferase family 9 protein [Spiribacter sp. 221]|uniref:glycosyltransferase family 9 protein n=1 Tax=Spiribacter onubensis TaxID=3122420 RepID=UPI00349F389E